MPTPLLHFGNILAEKRREQGYSQVSLAEAVGLPVKTIRNYEEGNSVPRLDALTKIATLFDIMPQRLIPVEDIEVFLVCVKHRICPKCKHILPRREFQDVRRAEGETPYPYCRQCASQQPYRPIIVRKHHAKIAREFPGVGLRIRAFRKNLGLTLDEFGAQVQHKGRTVATIESGQSNPTKLLASIKARFGVDLFIDE